MPIRKQILRKILQMKNIAFLENKHVKVYMITYFAYCVKREKEKNK